MSILDTLVVWPANSDLEKGLGLSQLGGSGCLWVVVDAWQQRNVAVELLYLDKK